MTCDCIPTRYYRSPYSTITNYCKYLGINNNDYHKSKLCRIERLIHWNWYGDYLLDNDYVTSGGNKCKFLDNHASYNHDTSVDFQRTWCKTNNIIPWFVVSDNSFDICCKHKESNF